MPSEHEQEVEAWLRFPKQTWTCCLPSQLLGMALEPDSSCTALVQCCFKLFGKMSQLLQKRSLEIWVNAVICGCCCRWRCQQCAPVSILSWGRLVIWLAYVLLPVLTLVCTCIAGNTVLLVSWFLSVALCNIWPYHSEPVFPHPFAKKV